jgi:hypothetical protein
MMTRKDFDIRPLKIPNTFSPDKVSDFTDACKLDVDFNCPAYSEQMFVDVVQKPNTYFGGVYHKQPRRKKEKLIGFFIMQRKNNDYLKIIRFAVHFEYDIEEVLTAMFDRLALGNSPLVTSVRARQVEVCKALASNGFILHKTVKDGYTHPTDDKYVYVREVADV